MPHTLARGETVEGKYQILFSGDSTVLSESYRAKDAAGGAVRLELINLSRLPSSSFDTQGDLLQVSLLSHIRHENLPRLRESGRTTINNQQFAFLVFDFFSGESVADKMKREAVFSLYSAIPIIIELLEAVDYLHKLPDPVVHNNIAPGTVLLDYSSKHDKPVLLYFEQASLLSLTSQRLVTEKLLLFNVAPEVLNNVFTPKSDLFAVGALLYQMLTGLPPWYNEELNNKPFSKVKTALEIVREKPLTFSFTGGEELDDQWRYTIIKALSPDPSNRFQNASEFILALKGEVVIGKQDIKKVVSEDTNHKERKTGSGFDKIAGMNELKEMLYNDVIRALHEKDLYASYGVSIPNGMLLYGPPGCGKTFIAQKFAEEVGFNFVMIKPSDLQSKYINATQENIGKLFREAEEKAPTILFFDELDALVPSREGELHHMHSSAVNEFLAQMTNCGEKGIFVVGATNRPDKIDTAILRTGRLDKVVYLAPPDHLARRSMFELYLKNRPIDLGLDYDQLASMTENMVSSDIKFLVDEASRKALKVRGRITTAIFDEVLRDTKPSVTITEIRKYEALKERWEAND